MVYLQVVENFDFLRLEKITRFQVNQCCEGLHIWWDFSHDNVYINSKGLNNYFGVPKPFLHYIIFMLKVYENCLITKQK